MTPETKTPREEALEWATTFFKERSALVRLESPEHAGWKQEMSAMQYIIGTLSTPEAVEGLDFDVWLKTVCFQKPTPEAYDLAKCAWEYSQGRTQAVPDGLLARLKEQQEYHYQNSDRAQELSGDKEHYSASYVEAAKGNAIGECILVLERVLSAAPTPPVNGSAKDDGEWFFRWIARGKAKHAGMTMDQCADMIWHHPSNPYRENNPWEEPAQPESGA